MRATVATVRLVVALLMLLPAAALASPNTMLVEGVIVSSGGPAPDGDYKLTFKLHDAASAGKELWAEGPVTAKVTGGRFSYALGATKPIDGKAIAAAKNLWLGIAVGADPELPRSSLHGVAWAMHAASAASLTCTDCVNSAHIAGGSIKPADVQFAYAGAADGIKGGAAAKAKALDCTGCVGVGHLKFDKDVDLKDKTLTAAKITSGGDVVAKGTVAAAKFVGDGSGLTGIKVPSGDCPKGQVVAGIKADGSLNCVPGFDASNLPKDAIDEVSNDLLANQFTDTIKNGGKRKIVDNNPEPIVDEIDFPDIGIAQAFDVNIKLTNSNIKNVVVWLLPPDAAVLATKNTAEFGTVVTNGPIKSWPANPTFDSKWKHYTLHKLSGSGTSLDTSYPSKTKPATGDLSEWIGKNPKGKWRLIVADNSYKNNKDDGELIEWSISLKTLSNQKVQVKGNLVLASKTAPCDSFAKGAIKYSPELNAIQVCDGVAWFPRLVGTSKDDAALDCKQIKDWAPQAKSGTYWIDPDGAGKGAAPYEVYCDQETGGGGWTMVVKVKGNDPTMNRYNKNQWYDGKGLGDCKALKDENALCPAYSTVQFSDVLIRGLANPLRNLAWRHREVFANMKDTVRKFERYHTTNKLFGALSNLDFNGHYQYHRDCAWNAYGFHGADHTYTFNSYLGVKNGWRSGHAGGVISVGNFNHNNWNTHPSYGYMGGLTMYCLSDFAIGGGYHDMNTTNEKYAINTHWWGNGNGHSHSWKTHAVFVRRAK